MATLERDIASSDERRTQESDNSAPGAPAGTNPKTAPDPDSNGEKDPADWVSGEDPMTGAQASYLKTLSEETGTPAYRDNLTKAEASMLIDELKAARDKDR